MKLMTRIFLSTLVCLVFLVACQGKKGDAAAGAAEHKDSTAHVTAPSVAVNAAGKKTFETYCVLCHGVDGKLGLNASKDLTVSVISLDERIVQVTNGKGLMTPFKDILTEDEIKAVAEYTVALKK
ncbi:MAG: cytochrome c [Saprospiraceae bacterium]